MSDEASNILRRFRAVAELLDPGLGYLRPAARTLRPEDLRKLARESGRHATELRGLARSIIRYGGPEAVRRDADPELVEAVHRIGWLS